MRYRLLDILACPLCGEFPLRVVAMEAKTQSEVSKGTLYCPNCHAEFPIDEGVPNFIRNDSYVENGVLEQKSEYEHIQYEKSYWYPQVVIDRVKSKIDRSFARDSFLLDLGTGVGVWANALSNDFSTVGLDIDMFNLKNGKKKYPHIDFICASATKLPFRDNSISVIFSGLFLHHLYLLGLDKIFTEVNRTLISGGQFLSYEPNKFNPVFTMRLKFVQFLIRHFGHDFVWRRFGWFETLEERFLSPFEVRSIAFKAGLDSQVETCFGVPSVVLDKMPFLTRISQLLEKNVFLAGSFFLDGRKNKKRRPDTK